jgi:hypothetical protein
LPSGKLDVSCADGRRVAGGQKSLLQHFFGAERGLGAAFAEAVERAQGVVRWGGGRGGGGAARIGVAICALLLLLLADGLAEGVGRGDDAAGPLEDEIVGQRRGGGGGRRRLLLLLLLLEAGGGGRAPRRARRARVDAGKGRGARGGGHAQGHLDARAHVLDDAAQLLRWAGLLLLLLLLRLLLLGRCCCRLGRRRCFRLLVSRRRRRVLQQLLPLLLLQAHPGRHRRRLHLLLVQQREPLLVRGDGGGALGTLVGRVVVGVGVWVVLLVRRRPGERGGR